MLSLLLLAAMPAADPLPLPPGYRLQYSQSFDAPDSLKDVVVRDPRVWKHTKTEGGGSIELTYDRKKWKDPNPTKHRSPFHIALVADKVFTSFVMDLEMQSTIAPYNHQSMCVFFGYQDPEHFYYSHIAVKTDDRAHNIFIVNDAPRTKISTETTSGLEWGDKKWHKVRVVRDAVTGKTEVYVDDMTKPIMRGVDKSFARGWVGFGSFDDIGLIRNVKIYAAEAEEKRNPFLKPIESK